jgi:hypothetical protein
MRFDDQRELHLLRHLHPIGQAVAEEHLRCLPILSRKNGLDQQRLLRCHIMSQFGHSLQRVLLLRMHRIVRIGMQIRHQRTKPQFLIQ